MDFATVSSCPLATSVLVFDQFAASEASIHNQNQDVEGRG
jgi:hypothetical protein